MKTRNKNPELKWLIETLNKKATEKKSVWKGIAKGLNRPRNVRYEVNLFRIDKCSGAGTLVVPGVVLGEGNIKKPVNVAALKFTGQAREKIIKAGGSCISLHELIKKDIKPSEIRIIG